MAVHLLFQKLKLYALEKAKTVREHLKLSECRYKT
jgi:hypothetical protein